MSYLDEIVNDFFRDSEIDLMTAMENFNFSINNSPEIINEADYEKTVQHLKIELLDIDRFISVNECQKITNPVFYSRDNIPTSDGLLSNEIFGITQADRAGIFGYIDLGQWFIDPTCYKAWTKIDSKVRDVVHKNGKFIITPKGEIVEDPAGKNGVKFLKDNIDKIVFKTSESLKRDLKVKYLEYNRKKMFINKYIVIPPYYRDSNTGKRSIGVGGVNKIYSQLLISINSLSMTQDYGFDMSGALEGKVQELLVALYDWFAGNANSTIQVDEGVGISGKTGLLRRSALSKTSNYTARLVISPCDVKVNRPEDMMVDYDHSAVPLHACMACFKPFVQFYVRRFFENEFSGTEQYPIIVKGKEEYAVPKDPLIQFSDERISEEMEKFIHSKNNRFRPITLELEDGRFVDMAFKGNIYSGPEIKEESIMKRRLTWCDIFYVACCQAIKGRYVLCTRYPVDSLYNTIVTQVVVSSTKETEPMTFKNTFYKYYPRITEDDIGESTDNKFIDTLRISNIYLSGAGADYDGDTMSIKAAFIDETNEELGKMMNSKINFINIGGVSLRSSGSQVIQSIYNLTKILDADKDKLKPVEL